MVEPVKETSVSSVRQECNFWFLDSCSTCAVAWRQLRLALGGQRAMLSREAARIVPRIRGSADSIAVVPGALSALS
jgi:hypothetical protein